MASQSTSAGSAGVTVQHSSRVALAAFGVGFALALLGGQLALHGSTGGSSCEVGFRASHHRQCRRPTKSGLCVEDVFDAVDNIYQDAWPGTVDLLIRSFVAGQPDKKPPETGRFFLLEMVFESVDHMWPKNIGDIVLVLNHGDEAAISLVPTWVKVHFEKNSVGIPRNLVQQWSYGWADQYTTADFVAITDDDIMFIMKVTPPLLFNLTERKPYVIGSNRNQTGVFVQSTEFFVGKGTYSANFMVSQPFVVPRAVFPAFRQHVEKDRPSDLGSYNQAFKWFTRNARSLGKNHIQHTALGNFIYNFMPEKVHFAMEWSSHTPIPRVTTHVPWTTAFLDGSNFDSSYSRYSSLYISTAATYAHEGLCRSLPAGELPGCDEVKSDQAQSQVWMYAYDWQDWPLLLYKRDDPGTVVYDEHIAVMHCVYHKLARMAQRGGLANLMMRTKKVVDNLKGCLRDSGGAAAAGGLP